MNQQATAAELYAKAMSALFDIQGGELCEDDLGMETAEDEDLLGWADDLEARIGLDVTEFRAALEEFIKARSA